MGKTALRCSECGYKSLQWVGRCPGCGAWDALAPEAGPKAHPVVSLKEASSAPEQRILTGIEGLDAVLGGGLVKGSVVLLAGEPGVGKSTLALQAAAGLSDQTEKVLMVCGEESVGQVAARARRLGVSQALNLTSTRDVSALLPQVAEHSVIVVDSVQTLIDPKASGEAGSVTQVRSVAAALAEVARVSGTAVILIGHVTKDGSVAGPRVLEHLVDVVAVFEGDRGMSLRTLRGIKNRFGGTGELAVFEMSAKGLQEVADPSSLMVSHRSKAPGSAIGCVLEGRRGLCLEFQTLVLTTPAQFPKRIARGIESSRLGVLLAVIEKRAGLKLSGAEVYASVAGGLSTTDPGCDLPLALSFASAFRDSVVKEGIAAVGEIGLGGEVRSVPGMSLRVKELGRMGFEKVIVAKGFGRQLGPHIIETDSVAEAISLAL